MSLNLFVNEKSLERMWGSNPVAQAVKFKHSAKHLQRKWLEALPAVNRHAILAATLMSHSYRDFRVGVAGYCHSRATGEFGIFCSGNLKLWRGGCKLCGEMGLGSVIPARFDLTIGISIYAEKVQPDASGHKPRTLHPCLECRLELEEDKRVKSWTRIYTCRPWQPGDLQEERKKKFVREHMSFRELLQIHKRAAQRCLCSF